MSRTDGLQISMKAFKRLFAFLFLLLTLGVIILCALFWYYSRDLPDYEQLERYDPPVVTRIYASDGRLFQEFAEERRVFIPISQIPQHIINTFLAAEDKNFYHHHGIDLFSICRTLLTNFKRASSGRRLAGASTITQQVARNFLLTNEVSLARKIKEAILSFRLEKAYSKQKILELYLNQIYLGLGAYGVGAASLSYFGKKLSELTAAEAAFLAALPKAPSTYHPIRHPERSKTRRDWVIDRMVELHVLTPELGAQAKAESLPKAVGFQSPDGVKGDFFSEEIRRELMARYGQDVLYKGGLTVRSTLIPRLQKIAEKALRKGLETYDHRHGWRGPIRLLSGTPDTWLDQLTQTTAQGISPDHSLAVVTKIKDTQAEILLPSGKQGVLPLEGLKWARPIQKGGTLGPEPKKPGDILKIGMVVVVEAQENTFLLTQIPEAEGALIAMDPNTGNVLAMVGGYNFARSQYNHATQALRQPGSVFKIFTFMEGLERGLSPITRILDEAVEIDPGYGQEVWRPRNIMRKFYGVVTFRRAFEQSYNASTVQLAKTLGIKPIVDLAIRLGIYDSLPAYPAVVLGAGETTLLRLTAAFAQIANGGRQVRPTFLLRIQDRHGKTLYRSDQRACTACATGEPTLLPDTRPRTIDRRIAYQMTSLLEGVILRGSGRRGAVKGFPLAGKSGTSNDSKDCWFIGFSPDLVVGVWTGYDDPKSLGQKETGGTVAAPIFGAFMKEALTHPTQFRIPSGLVFKRVALPQGGALEEPFLPGTEPTPENGRLDQIVGQTGITLLPPPPLADTVSSQPLPSDEQLFQELSQEREPEPPPSLTETIPEEDSLNAPLQALLSDITLPSKEESEEEVISLMNLPLEEQKVMKKTLGAFY